MSTKAERLEWARSARQRFASSPALRQGVDEADYVALLVGCGRVEAMSLMAEVERADGAKKTRKSRR